MKMTFFEVESEFEAVITIFLCVKEDNGYTCVGVKTIFIFGRE